MALLGPNLVTDISASIDTSVIFLILVVSGGNRNPGVEANGVLSSPNRYVRR